MKLSIFCRSHLRMVPHVVCSSTELKISVKMKAIPGGRRRGISARRRPQRGSRCPPRPVDVEDEILRLRHSSNACKFGIIHLLSQIQKPNPYASYPLPAGMRPYPVRLATGTHLSCDMPPRSAQMCVVSLGRSVGWGHRHLLKESSGRMMI